MKKSLAAPATLGTAVGAALLVITLILALSSPNPFQTVAAFFTRPFSSWWYAGNMLNLAGLLMIAGSGSALALRAGTFNLGGEAQIYLPGLVTAVLLASPSPDSALAGLPVPLKFTLALFAAGGSGALLGWIPGILRAKWKINELLTSFLLSAALLPVLDYLTGGPLRDQTKNLLATAAIDPAFIIKPLLEPSYFNISFFAAIMLVLVAAFCISNTGPGFRFHISGKAPEFARYSGFHVGATNAAGMALSGILHGITGFFAITGTWYMCHQGFSAGMGWSALAVALIARRNLILVIPAALLYAWLQTASEVALLSTRFSFDSTSLVQAVIFLVVSAQTLPRAFRRKQ